MSWAPRPGLGGVGRSRVGVRERGGRAGEKAAGVVRAAAAIGVGCRPQGRRPRWLWGVGRENRAACADHWVWGLQLGLGKPWEVEDA